MPRSARRSRPGSIPPRPLERGDAAREEATQHSAELSGIPAHSPMRDSPGYRGIPRRRRVGFPGTPAADTPEAGFAGIPRDSVGISAGFLDDAHKRDTAPGVSPVCPVCPGPLSHALHDAIVAPAPHAVHRTMVRGRACPKGHARGRRITRACKVASAKSRIPHVMAGRDQRGERPVRRDARALSDHTGSRQAERMPPPPVPLPQRRRGNASSADCYSLSAPGGGEGRGEVGESRPAPHNR